MNNEYCVEISYEEWYKIMKDIIRKQKNELKYYILVYNNLSKKEDNFSSYKINHYKKKIFSTLEAILENQDLVNIVSKSKDEYIFCIDSHYTPVAIYVGKNLRKMISKYNLHT